MSSNTKLGLVVGLTLVFLLVATYGEAAPCGEERTGVPCTSDAMCKALCTGKEKAGYTDGRCSLEFVVGDPSCVCSKLCGRQAMMVVAVAGEHQVEKPVAATAGRRGMVDGRLI